MLDVYCNMLGIGRASVKEKPANIIGRRLSFLSRIANGNLERGKMVEEDAITFYESLLDCHLFSAATGVHCDIFDSLTLDEVSLLGNARARQGELTGPDNFVLDYLFHLQVHAWLSTRGYGPIRDLRHDKRLKDRKVSDFKVVGDDGRVELIECKRIHPRDPYQDNPLPKIVLKIKARVADAAIQLRETARALGSEASCKHVILDVSAYDQQRREVQHKTGPVTVVGYTQAEIEFLGAKVQSESTEGIDKITFCFGNLVFVNHLPCALVQRTSALVIRADHPSAVDYQGWTVEGYQFSNSKYAELRVSCTARSASWIKFSYHNIADADHCQTWGPEESLIKPR